MGKAFYNFDIVSSIPILDVCDELGIYVYRRGSSCWCKLRENERTASCKLYIDKGGNDSFYDFGSGTGGNVINFVSQYLGCDWQTALEDLANRFHIEPMNNSEYFKRNELTNREYEKIGIYGDLATKNLDIDLEKMSIAEAQEYSLKYKMSVNELRKAYPKVYTYDILVKRAIPYVRNLRNEYYWSLYQKISLHFTAVGHFDINNIVQEELKELIEQREQLEKTEKCLKRALAGTPLSFDYRHYNLLKDLELVYTGKVVIRIGDKTYTQLAQEATRNHVFMEQREIPAHDYWPLLERGLDTVGGAAGLKWNTVTFKFLSDYAPVVDMCLETYYKEKESNAQEPSPVREPAEQSRDQPVLVGAAR